MLRRILWALPLGLAVLGMACNGPVGTNKTNPNGETAYNEGPNSSEDIGDYLYKPENPPVQKPQGSAAQHLVDPVVIPDCRLNVYEKEDVPSQKDGVLLFLGTDLKAGEEQTLSPKQIVTVKINDKERKFRRLDKGDFVEKDQLIGIVFDQLARDDVAIKNAKLKVAEADVVAAEYTKDEAMARYKTQEILYGQGGKNMPATSKEDLRAALLLARTKYYEWESKKEAVKQAQAELRQADNTLKMYEIHSAVPGQITEVYKRQGEAVKALEQVVQVHNQKKVRVEGFMDLQYSDRLQTAEGPKKDMKVVVEASVPQSHQKPLVGHRQEVTSVAVGKTREKTVVVSVSLDHTIHVWDPAKGTDARERPYQLPSAAGHAYVACTGPAARANLMVCGGQDGMARLYNLDSPSDSPSRELENQHQGAITCVAFSPDGQTCATGGDDRRICLWDTDTGNLRYYIPGAHNGAVTSLQFTPQCQLVSAGKDNRLLVWTLGKDRYRLERFPGNDRSGDVSTLGVSPDGRRVLFDHGKALQVLSVPDGRYEGGLQHASGTAGFTTFALFSPDSNLILTAGGAEGNVQLWRAPNANDLRGYEIRQLLPENQSRSPVTCAAFAPDNSFLVTGYKNRGVFLWHVPKEKELAQKITAKVSLVGINVETNNQVRIVAELTDQDKPLRPGTTAALVVDPGE